MESTTHPCWACSCGFKTNFKFRTKCFKCALVKGAVAPPIPPSRSVKHGPGKKVDGEDSDEARLKGKLHELAELKATSQRVSHPGLAGLIQAMEAEITDLKKNLEMQRTPESRLQTSMSRLAAVRKERATATAEVKRLQQLLEVATAAEAQLEAREEDLETEVQTLKEATLRQPPRPAQPAVFTAAQAAALAAMLQAAGTPVAAEALLAAMQALVPAIPPPAEVAMEDEAAEAAATLGVRGPENPEDPPGLPRGAKRAGSEERSASQPPPTRVAATALQALAGGTGQ